MISRLSISKTICSPTTKRTTRRTMKKNIAMLLLASPAALMGQAQAQDQHSYHIDHLEPASWWTGMQSRQLQLMVHGQHIGDLEPTLDYPGVHITSVAHLPNPNYLFIDLDIAPNAAPGQLDLVFKHGATVLHTSYALQARVQGSAQRIGFNSSDAIYEVMPDRFANGNPSNDSVAGLADKLDRADGSGRHGGDIQGMADHLDYVAAMGYTVIWPTPMLTSDMPYASYHGYATTDHYQIDPRYGSNEEYRHFVAQARKHGLGVIQDVVLNHIGSHHWWMQDMPMADWINYQGKFVPTMHHRVSLQDPYGSQEDKRNFTGGWFVENMPDLNQANPYLATYLIQNNIWWIEYAGLSGLRVDTYSYSDGAFLAEWTRRIMAEYPHLNLVGEEWSTTIPVVSRWLEGKRNFDGFVSHMPSMMDFPLNDTLRRALAAKDGDENSKQFIRNPVAGLSVPASGQYGAVRRQPRHVAHLQRAQWRYGFVQDGDGVCADRAAHTAAVFGHRDPDDQQRQGPRRCVVPARFSGRLGRRPGQRFHRRGLEQSAAGGAGVFEEAAELAQDTAGHPPRQNHAVWAGAEHLCLLPLRRREEGHGRLEQEPDRDHAGDGALP